MEKGIQRVRKQTELTDGSQVTKIKETVPTDALNNNPSFDATIVISTNSIVITDVETIDGDDYQTILTVDKTNPLNLHITGSSSSKI